jgi:hypothetical protein
MKNKNIDDMSDLEYNRYLGEAIMRNLRYMVDEGIVSTAICPKTGETLYCMKSEEEIAEEIAAL